MKGIWCVARVAGVNLYVHWSFSLVILLVVGQGIWHKREWAGIMFILLALLLLFVCVVLHELGHVLMAVRLQVAVKNVVVLPVGGLAQIQSSMEKPWQELLISAAGPLVNLLLTLTLALILLIVDARLLFGFFTAPRTVIDAIFLQTTFWQSPVMGLMLFLFFANTVLFVFNLIPTFPMDGGRLLRATLAMFLPYVWATQLAIVLGQIFAIFLVLTALRLRSMGLLFIALFVLVAGLPLLMQQRRRRVLVKQRIKE
jgi:Zn-dependent protease